MVPYSGGIVTALKANVMSRWNRRAASKGRIASSQQGPASFDYLANSSNANP
jgi:hypothetical protein